MVQDDSRGFNWAGLPVIATLAQLLCREVTLENEHLRVQYEVVRSRVPGRIWFVACQGRSRAESLTPDTGSLTASPWRPDGPITQSCEEHRGSCTTTPCGDGHGLHTRRPPLPSRALLTLSQLLRRGLDLPCSQFMMVISWRSAARASSLIWMPASIRSLRKRCPKLLASLG